VSEASDLGHTPGEPALRAAAWWPHLDVIQTVDFHHEESPMAATIAARHMTVKDICEELGISRSTFYDWRAARKAPGVHEAPQR
jgi:hypothetical protein